MAARHEEEESSGANPHHVSLHLCMKGRVGQILPLRFPTQYHSFTSIAQAAINSTPTDRSNQSKTHPRCGATSSPFQVPGRPSDRDQAWGHGWVSPWHVPSAPRRTQGTSARAAIHPSKPADPDGPDLPPSRHLDNIPRVKMDRIAQSEQAPDLDPCTLVRRHIS